MQDVPLTIGSLLRYATQVHGDAQVLTFDGTGLSAVDFTELGERTARLASALQALGVRPDDRVATFAWNNLEHLEAYLAVPAMGAVLHTGNIRLYAEQVTYTLNHARDRVVIVDDSLVPVLAPVLPTLETVHTVLVTGDGDAGALEGHGKQVLRYDEVVAGASPDFRWPDVDERSAAAICYTSGTTGNPKAVVYSHRSNWLHSTAMCSGNGLAISWTDRILPIVPMFHANSWGLPYAALMAGADLLMPDRFLQAEPLVRLIELGRPTLSGAVPTIWNDLLHYLRANPGRDISSLRLVACGGSAVPRTLIEALQAEHGVTIVQAWGMTETSPVATMARPPRGATGEDAGRIRASQGRPVCGVELRLAADDGSPLPWDGEAVGEIEVRGPWVTGSYYLVEDPDKFDGGWLRTGDVGTIDPLGYVTLTDRAKDVIKSGGEWISSVALETTLIGHPDVVEAVVVAVPDERWAERPLATVVLREGAAVTPEDLRAWLGERVPRWWLPERWAFVGDVPRTSVGKFDKKVLRARYAEGALQVRHVAPVPAQLGGAAPGPVPAPPNLPG